MHSSSLYRAPGHAPIRRSESPSPPGRALARGGTVQSRTNDEQERANRIDGALRDAGRKRRTAREGYERRGY
jgi:hypothetical protein